MAPTPRRSPDLAQRRVKGMRRAAGLAALFFAIVVAPMPGQAAEFQARALAGFPGDLAPGDGGPGGTADFRGAIEITWERKAFGGFSALDVDRTGSRVVALSDRGAWLELALIYAEDRLVGAERASLKRLRGPGGAKLKKNDGDAEALSPDGRGGFVVAFEQPHRLWWYPPFRKPFSLPPAEITLPPEAGSLRKNHGVEALTRLCDGRYLLIAEQSKGTDGPAAAWVGGAGGWTRLNYQQAPGYSPSGAATLPDCSAAVLERGAVSEGQRSVRVVRLEIQTLETTRSAPVRGRIMLGPFGTSAKFEGIAAAKRPSGTVLLYLVSDDDFAGPTVLAAFAVAGFSMPSSDP